MNAKIPAATMITTKRTRNTLYCVVTKITSVKSPAKLPENEDAILLRFQEVIRMMLLIAEIPFHFQDELFDIFLLDILMLFQVLGDKLFVL